MFGEHPWASASPRKLMPRSTTHVPTSDVQSAVRSTAHNVVRMNSLSVNGVTHHDHGSVRKFTSATVADLGGLRSTFEPGGLRSGFRIIGPPRSTAAAHRGRRRWPWRRSASGRGRSRRRTPPRPASRCTASRRPGQAIGERGRLVGRVERLGEDRRHSGCLDVGDSCSSSAGEASASRRRPGSTVPRISRS